MYLVNHIHLCLIFQRRNDLYEKTYEMFPVWIAFADEIKTKDVEETRTQIQMVIDAETGEIIS